MIRERLADVIQREQDLTVCGEAEDVHSALAAVERTHPDLAIVDLLLKESHGMDLIKDLRARYPEVAVLVFSLHDESPLAERVIRGGARGYITKQEATHNVLAAIRTVLAGGVYLSDKAAQQVASKVATTAPNANSFEKLSDRELRVLELIGKGLSTRHVAQKLNLGVPTIETYRARIKEKLRLRDAHELLQYAIRWNQLGSSNP
jgi:DNA-binding NarL/FixJ family response regulator